MDVALLSELRQKTKISGAAVRATKRDTTNGLTLIPPYNYNLETGYFAFQDRSLYVFSNLRLIDEQDQIGLNEEKTQGYALLNMGASKKFEFGNNFNSLNVGVTVYNTLNKTYVDHMSILRAFNVSSPGRNIMLNLKYNF